MARRKTRNLQSLFKPYIVTRKAGQCQVLIPLVELDALCVQITDFCQKMQEVK